MSRVVYTTNGSPNGLSFINGESDRPESRRSPRGFNGGTSFEVITPPGSSGQRTPADLSYVNPMGMGQISMTDVTLEQAVERVQELMRENKELREYMKENNEMMRHQYETLAEYKKKVQDCNTQTKDKFEQTRRVILELKKDNDQLKSSLQSQSEEQNRTLTVKILELEQAEAKLTEDSSLKDQLIDSLRDQLKDLSQFSQSSQTGQSASDLVFVTNSKEDEEKMKRLESERDQLANQVDYLNSHLLVKQEDLSKLQADLKLQKRLQDEYEKLSNENLELSNKLAKVVTENKTTKTENKTLKGNVVDIMSNMEDLTRKNKENESLLKSMGYTLVEGTPKQGEFPTVQGTREEEQLQRQGLRLATPSEVMVQIQNSSRTEQLQRQLSQKERQVDELVIELHQKDQELQVLRNNRQVQSPTHTGDVQNWMSQNLTLMSEIKDTHGKLDSAKLAVDKKNGRIAELEERLVMQDELMKQRDEDSALMASLRMSLKGYEEALNAERREHQNTKKQLIELRQTFNSLTADYKSILHNFESLQESSMRQKSIVDAGEKQRLLDKISQLTAEMVSGEEAAKYREAQIKRIKEEMEQLKMENETIPVLRAQADVWKLDFDAERNSRERQHAENQQLKQEFHNLQVQNQQILDEMETMSKGQFAEMQRKHGGGVAAHQQQMQSYLKVGDVSPPQAYRAPLQYPYQNQPINYNTVSPPPPHTPQPSHAYVNYPYPPQQYPAEGGAGQPTSRGSGGYLEEGDYQPFCCPKCNLPCPDVDTLQIHVLDCIDH